MALSRKRVVLIVLGLLIVSVLWFLFSHALVEVSISNPDGGNVSFSFTNDKDRSSVHAGSSPKQTVILASGNYQLTAEQGDRHYFSIIKVGRFLHRTTVNVTLLAEKQRTYVADNPAHCMFYSQILYSFDCGASFNSVNQHVPATPSTPTYTQRLPIEGTPEGVVEGLVKTAQGNIALVHEGDIEGPGHHVLYLLDDHLSIIKSRILDLNDGTNFTLLNFNKGFVIYSSDETTVLTYPAYDSVGTRLSLTKPLESNLKPVSLGVNGSHITIAYTDAPDGTIKPAKNEVVDYLSGKVTKTIWTGTPLIDSVACGAANVCALDSNHSLEVLLAGKDKPAYFLTGVQAMQSLNGQVLLAMKAEMVYFNTDSRAGDVDYTYSDYGFCGLAPKDGESYLLCLQSGAKKVALLVNRAAANRDSIDKKIQQLQAIPQVQAVSINNNFIFVMPQLAQLEYQASLNITEPNPVVQAAIDQKINSKIDSIGIARNLYKIIITE